MSDDLVTTVLVALSLAGPAMSLGSMRKRSTSDDLAAMKPRSGLFVLGVIVTLLAWPALALWAWLSTAHWGML